MHMLLRAVIAVLVVTVVAVLGSVLGGSDHAAPTPLIAPAPSASTTMSP